MLSGDDECAMIRAEASATIARSVDTVYEFVIGRFFDNYPRWAPEVEHLQALGPAEIVPGARGRQVRVDQGRRSDTVFEVTHVDPGRRARFRGERDARFVIEYRFAPRGDGAARLTFEFRLEREELFMRPFRKLIRLAIQDGSERTVRNIKGLIERER